MFAAVRVHGARDDLGARLQVGDRVVGAQPQVDAVGRRVGATGGAGGVGHRVDEAALHAVVGQDEPDRVVDVAGLDFVGGEQHRRDRDLIIGLCQVALQQYRDLVEYVVLAGIQRGRGSALVTACEDHRGEAASVAQILAEADGVLTPIGGRTRWRRGEGGDVED